MQFGLPGLHGTEKKAETAFCTLRRNLFPPDSVTGQFRRLAQPIGAFVKRVAEADESGRRLLIKALAAGLVSGGLSGCSPLAAQVGGGRPTKLPAGQSVFRSSGTVTVNDQPVTADTQVRPGDTLRTGKDSEIIFVVTDCSFLLRADSQVVLEAAKAAAPSTRLAGLKLLVGKLLSVYPPGPVRIETVTATAQILGTGVYVESDMEQTYFCTCFGVTEVLANDDPDSRQSIAATHHNKPLYILAGARNRGNSIRPAPFINHTDQELAIIETLVGRTLPPAFVFPDRRYQAPVGGIYRP